MKKSFIIFLCFVSIALNLFAQDKANLIAWDEKRPLTWENFKGVADEQYPFHALTAGSMYYEYKQLSGTEFIFVLYMGFDQKKSWVKAGEATDELLKHEQVHFDIYELYARIMMKKIAESKTLSGTNFSDKMKALFEKTFKELVKFQQHYDRETDHSRNKEKQKEWNDKIAKLLKEHEGYKDREVAFKVSR